MELYARLLFFVVGFRVESPGEGHMPSNDERLQTDEATSIFFELARKSGSLDAPGWNEMTASCRLQHPIHVDCATRFNRHVLAKWRQGTSDHRVRSDVGCLKAEPKRVKHSPQPFFSLQRTNDVAESSSGDSQPLKRGELFEYPVGQLRQAVAPQVASCFDFCGRWSRAGETPHAPKKTND